MSTEPLDRACPICGSNGYLWGHLRDDERPVRFVARDIGFFAALTKPRGGAANDYVYARKCRSCGNVQAFAGVEKAISERIREAGA